MFKVKDAILGSKKWGEEPSAVKDPKTNKLVFDPTGIKSVSAKYCQDLLTNREPSAEFRRDLLWKERVHAVRMTESFENDPKFTLERFNQTFDILNKTKKEKFKFILKAGQSYLGALFKLFHLGRSCGRGVIKLKELNQPMKRTHDNCPSNQTCVCFLQS